MKRHITLLAALVVFLGILCGCGKDGTIPTDPQDDAAKADVQKIIVTFQTISTSRIDDLDSVVQAINDISIPAIGVEIEMKVVDAIEAYTSYYSWISSGETIDLMVLNYQDINGYISKNMLYPIDDLLENYGSAIQSVMEEGYRLTEGSVVDGKAYGVVSVQASVGAGGGIWIPQRYLEESGFEFDTKRTYTLEEIDRLLSRLKALYPNSYPLGQVTSNSYSSTMGYYLPNFDTLGTDLYSGAIIQEGTTTLENPFATEQYAKLLQYLRKWYKRGYIYPDAATTDASIAELISAGIVLSYPLSSSPAMVTDDTFGEEVVCLRTTDISVRPQYSKTGFWVIPITSQAPEAAMKFLDLMYSDARVCNLLVWGIEGDHYVLTDPENGIVSLPEGIDIGSRSYYNPLGLYGDMRNAYIMGDAQLRQQQADYSAEALQNQQGIRGFIYSSANVEYQLSLLDGVVRQYVPVLESGSVDPDIYYPAFLEALERAGINEVIADKQQQLDAWLAEQETE